MSVTLLPALLLLALSVPVSASADQPSFAFVPAPSLGTTSAAATAGSVWDVALAGTGGATTTEVRRVDPGGVRSTTVLPSGDGRFVQVRSPLTPQPHGGMALVTAERVPATGATVAVRLQRFDRHGALAETTELPPVARGAAAFAVGRHGTVWFARACAGAAYRRDPRGRLTRVAIGRAPCGPARAEEALTEIALAPSGGVWIGNEPLGRIVRVDRRGRVSTWRPAPDPLTTDVALATGGLRLDPRGGVALTAPHEVSTQPQACVARVLPDGRLRRLRRLPCVFDGAGALLRWSSSEVVVRGAAGGPVRRLPAPDGRELAGVVPLPDGRVAYVAGRLDLSGSDPHHPPTWTDLAVGTVGARGLSAPHAAADAGLGGLHGGGGSSGLSPLAAGDGALWVPAASTDAQGAVTRGYLRVTLPR